MTSINKDIESLQDVEIRLEELNKLDKFSPREKAEFIDLALRRMEILDDIHYQRIGRRPIL